MARTKFIGAAGSGKTRAVLEAIIASIRDPHEVSFASMTNAARDAITARVADHYGVSVASLTAANWRTTHSTAIRGLGWGERVIHSGTAEYRKQAEIASGLPWDVVEPALVAWNLARMSGRRLRDVVADVRLVHPDAPTFASCLSVVRRYEEGKAREDWCDLIDPLLAFAGVKHAPDGESTRCRPQGDVPGGVRMLVLDEAQDASYLIYLVQRRLEDECGPEHTILAADPYQSIFSFTGGDPRFFMEWPVDREVVMERSWRCAAEVFSLGHRCLSGVSGYKDFGIRPADHPGEVIREDAARVQRAIERAGEGSVMLLARTNYRAEELAGLVDEPVAPIGSPASSELIAYRALHHLASDGVVSADDFAAVVGLLPAAGFFERGAKAKWSRREYGVSEVSPWRLRALGVTAAGCDAILSGSWIGSVKSPKAAMAWRARCQKVGPDRATVARVQYGTIHSAKGLEADAVVIDDSLPKATQRSVQAHRWAADEERRVSYVGVTRARRSCVVLQNSEPTWRRASWMR